VNLKSSANNLKVTPNIMPFWFSNKIIYEDTKHYMTEALDCTTWQVRTNQTTSIGAHMHYKYSYWKNTSTRKV